MAALPGDQRSAEAPAPSVVRLLKALADQTRLRLYHVLGDHELAVNEIVRVVDMSQPRVSRHLKILADAGLLSARRDGLRVYYRATEGALARHLGDPARELFRAQTRTAGEDMRRVDEVLRDRALETRRFFDRLGPAWSHLQQEIMGDLDLNKLIAGLAPDAEAAVDIGCGAGELLERLRGKAGRLIGVDSSARMLEAARARLAEADEVELRLGEGEHLPLRDGEVDLAVMNMSLHHLSDPSQGLREAGRVLAPGRTFLLAELMSHQREEMREQHGDRWLGFSPEQLGQWLAQAGLEQTGREELVLVGLTLQVITAVRASREAAGNRAVRKSKTSTGAA
jgi:ArsR family transcriptional regulator